MCLCDHIEIRVSVIDNGIGILDKESEKVFGKFYRVKIQAI